MYYDFGKGFVIEESSICDYCKDCQHFLDCCYFDVTRILRKSSCGHLYKQRVLNFNKGVLSCSGGCYGCHYECFDSK